MIYSLFNSKKKKERDRNLNTLHFVIANREDEHPTYDIFYELEKLVGKTSSRSSTSSNLVNFLSGTLAVSPCVSPVRYHMILGCVPSWSVGPSRQPASANLNRDFY